MTRCSILRRSVREGASPADEIWINDADVLLVPKSPLKVFDDWATLFFTQGLYRVALQHECEFSFLNTLLPTAAAAGT